LGNAARLLGKRPAALLGACLITLLLGVVDLTLPRVGSATDIGVITTPIPTPGAATTYFPVLSTSRLAGVARSTVFASSISKPEIFGLTPEAGGATFDEWRVPSSSVPIIPVSLHTHIPGFSRLFAVTTSGAGAAAKPAILTASVLGDQLETKLIAAGTHPSVVATSSINVGKMADGLQLEAIATTPWPHIGHALLTVSGSIRGRVVLSLYLGTTGAGGLVLQRPLPYVLTPHEFRVTFLCFPDAISTGCQVMWVSRHPDGSDQLAIHGLGPYNNYTEWSFQTLTSLSNNPALNFTTGLSPKGVELWYAIDPANGRIATLDFVAIPTKLRISL
jgi:hypothetical protein